MWLLILVFALRIELVETVKVKAHSQYAECPPNTVTCRNQGIIDPKTCNSCICPKYFSGDFCENLATGTAPVCNSRIMGATDIVETFNATVGLGMTDKYEEDPKDCYWMIMGPIGLRIELRIISISAKCMERCDWGGFEINLGQPDLPGLVICCTNSTETITSTTNSNYIRGYSRYNNVNLVFTYVAI